MSATSGSPYGELPPTDAAALGLDVQDPHEHHWFAEPTKEVGPKYVGAPGLRRSWSSSSRCSARP